MWRTVSGVGQLFRSGYKLPAGPFVAGVECRVPLQLRDAGEPLGCRGLGIENDRDVVEGKVPVGS